MNAPLYVAPHMPMPVPEAAPGNREVVDLLRQMIVLQQENVGLLEAQLANQDGGARWRAFLGRWEHEFPTIASACKQALPALERSYLALIRELTDRVNASDAADLEDEFVLSEFLDRFGIRVGQLGNILSQLAPIADAAPTEPTV